MRTAEEEGFERSGGFDVEGSDADGSAELVRSKGEVVDAEIFDGDGDFADGLSGVGVEVDFGAVLFFETLDEFGDFLDGFDSADFVVGEHDRDEDFLIWVFSDDFFEVGFEEVKVDNSLLVDGDFNARGSVSFGGFKAAWVFDGADEDGAVFESADDGIIGFGAAGREN